MFVGRTRELSELERLYAAEGFQMVVLYGRRRVGKTSLAARFSQGKPTLSYTAKVQSDAMNLADFSARIYAFFGLPASLGGFASWDSALGFVARQAGSQRLVFVFDEFPYAAQRNGALVSTFQVAIDHYFASTNVFIILTGSNQGFMEEKVLGGEGLQEGLGERNPLFGRRTSQIHLGPLGYRDAALMLPGASEEDLVRYYAVFGGTPYYLSGIDANDTFEANVERQFFGKGGLLYEEPMMLLRQELREPAIYSSILDAIANGANRPKSIADRMGEERTSVIKYLRGLISMGLVRKVAPFGESREHSRRGIYEIAEPTFSFWYRFVQPNLDSIELDAGELVARDLLASEEIPSYVGHWFEEICRQWVVGQAKAGTLPVSPTKFGRWWGADPDTRSQTDVDVVASNERRSELLVGECKWRNAFDETQAARNLVHRATLIGTYQDTSYVLFTKQPVREATREKLGGGWLCVDARGLYGGAS